MEGLALVDFHNLYRGRRDQVGIESAAEEIVDQVTTTFLGLAQEVQGIDIRLYGGWLDEDGLTSPDTEVLLPMLPYLRGRRRGIVVRPSLATTMLAYPGFQLRGTVRLRTRPYRQKMVDQMIGCDAIFVAGDASEIVTAVFTDDDDIIPSLMSAHSIRPGAARWIRAASEVNRPNDQQLRSLGLNIAIGKPDAG